MGAIERLRNRLTQRTVFGIIDDHRGPRDGLKRQPMQTDCAAQRANGDNTSKATKHGAQPSESIDRRQSFDQRLFINMVTLCLLREIRSVPLCFAAPWQSSLDFKLERQTEECANQDNQAKYHHVLHGRRYDDGSNDVAGNQKFQT
jgi:hypothetical protein